jgi:protein involved in polysaccharide export with SLBB domain
MYVRALFVLPLIMTLWPSAAVLADPPAAAAHAQTEAQAAPPLPYLLAGEDAISITVINFPMLTTQMVVPPDGRITVPLLDPILVTGKTTTELAELLTEKWRKYVINPSVTVALTQKRRENVLFYGFVTKAGTLEYRTGLRLIEALAEVGGIGSTGDPSQVTLTHKLGEKKLLDVSHPETRGGTDVDVLLQPGDVIFVPELRTQISILGEVNRPGSLPYKEDVTILDALTASGGVKDTADLTTATLLRDGKETKVDLDGLLRHGDLSQNMKLRAGDRLMVPEIRNRTYVFGNVGAPGYYAYKPGDRVLDALKASGGPGKDADLGKINVIHIDKQKNAATKVQVNIDKVLKKGDLTGNVLLQPGDVLFVPDRRHGFQIGDLFQSLSILGIVNSLTRFGR